jgi:hypothetical protein
VRASASAVTALPFTVIETLDIGLLLEIGLQGPHLVPEPAYGGNPGAKSRRFCLKSLTGTRITLNRERG